MRESILIMRMHSGYSRLLLCIRKGRRKVTIWHLYVPVPNRNISKFKTVAREALEVP